MTREQILQSFLGDDLIVEKNYLKEEEAKTFKWATPTQTKLIEVLKLAIDGEVSGESMAITERKINVLLNSQL